MIVHGVRRALVKGRGGGARLLRRIATQLVLTDTTLPELGLHLRKGFASMEEVACLQRVADSAFVGVDYASTHTDDLITRYRETAVNLNDGSIEDEVALSCLRRLQAEAWVATKGSAGRGRSLFPFIQMIDICGGGAISAHKDSAKLFGGFTAALVIGTGHSTIRFRKEQGEKQQDQKDEEISQIDVLLEPSDFYVMHQDLRWSWTHEVLETEEDQRRISFIVRDTPGFAGVFGNVF